MTALLRHFLEVRVLLLLLKSRDNSVLLTGYPEDHPALPKCCSRPQEPTVVACSFCTTPTAKAVR